MFSLFLPSPVMAPDHEGRALPGYGPSDSTDSGSDLPREQANTDSDAQGSGERKSVNRRDRDSDAGDIDVDAVVDEEQAGVSHRQPSPTRNGTVDR